MEMIGDRIRELRKKKGYSQDELAERIDANRVTVAKYETGKSIPSLDAIVRLADALSTTFEYLISGEGDPAPAEDEDSFCRRLRWYREIEGYSIEKLSEILGIDQKTYERYERGTLFPSKENALKIALFFHISLNTLLYGAKKNIDEETGHVPLSESDLKFALWGGDADQISNAQFEEVKQYAQFIKHRGPIK